MSYYIFCVGVIEPRRCDSRASVDLEIDDIAKAERSIYPGYSASVRWDHVTDYGELRYWVVDESYREPDHAQGSIPMFVIEVTP